MIQGLFFYSKNHLISKNSCMPIIFMALSLLVYSVPATAQTARTAEAMLGKKHPAIGSQIAPDKKSITSRTTEEMLTGSSQRQNIPAVTKDSSVHNPSASSSSSSSPSVHNDKPVKHRTGRINARHVVNGVKFEVASCKYVPEYKSVTCDFRATNLEPDVEAVIYCYTGTAAVDDKGNSLQCAHVWLGSNHSWNYAHGKLEKGTPVKGMIRLETRRAPEKLKVLKVSMALNGATESTLIKNIPVR